MGRSSLYVVIAGVLALTAAACQPSAPPEEAPAAAPAEPAPAPDEAAPAPDAAPAPEGEAAPAEQPSTDSLIPDNE